MEIDMNEVYAAIQTLYGDQSGAAGVQKEHFQKASEWLGNLQKSVGDFPACCFK